jgi:hypothetical protein
MEPPLQLIIVRIMNEECQFIIVIIVQNEERKAISMLYLPLESRWALMRKVPIGSDIMYLGSRMPPGLPAQYLSDRYFWRIGVTLNIGSFLARPE